MRGLKKKEREKERAAEGDLRKSGAEEIKKLLSDMKLVKVLHSSLRHGLPCG